MLRLKCLSAPASIKYQIAILDQLTAAASIPLIRYRSARSVGNSLIYDSPHGRKGGSPLKLALLGREACDEMTPALEGKVDAPAGDNG
jgi:hypothetical protein